MTDDPPAKCGDIVETAAGWWLIIPSHAAGLPVGEALKLALSERGNSREQRAAVIAIPIDLKPA